MMDAGALIGRAMTLYRVGEVEVARALLVRAAACVPAHPHIAALLGATASGDAPQLALRWFRRAVRLAPLHPGALPNLAVALLRAGQLIPARAALHAAAAAEPGAPASWRMLGDVLPHTGMAAKALQSLTRAAHLAPGERDAWTALAALLGREGQRVRATAALRVALALDPGASTSWQMLGETLSHGDRTDRAVQALARAIRLAPGQPALHVALADFLTRRRRPGEAVEEYRAALRLAHARDVATRMILAMNVAEAAPESILEAARDWARRYAEPLAGPRPVRSPDPTRRLRVGYLAPMFATLGRVFLPILRAHDPDAVETFVYADAVGARQTPNAPPYWTAAFYREVGDLDDEALAERIRADGIDILVDGLGFPTDRSRLLTLARRAAPIQVHFPVMSTTGMSAVDYLLVDPILVPPGEESLFHETVWRLPFGYHHAPLLDVSPGIGPLPLDDRGFLTFGSFNQAGKLGPRVPKAWADILARVPGSRLVLKATDLTPAVEAELLAELAACGVPPGRVTMVPPTATHAEHLACYAGIDIHLDSFPYNGVTTTAEALWMGVPVVTLAGRRVLDRYSASMLHAIGLDACVAGDVDRYVEAACRLAADAAGLRSLRAGLRDRLERSRLMDSATFTRDLEDAYRGMWRRLCDEAGRGVRRDVPSG